MEWMVAPTGANSTEPAAPVTTVELNGGEKPEEYRVAGIDFPLPEGQMGFLNKKARDYWRFGFPSPNQVAWT